MQSFYAFAGPYLEILTPPRVYPGGIDGLEDEYDRLYSVENDRLGWLNGRGDPMTEEVGGRRVWRHCAFPRREEPGVPRWPMYFPMLTPTSGDNAVVDLRKADIAAEVAWFERAFTAELDLVRRVAVLRGFDHGVRWGMVCYVY
jgi:hypothetical protein